MEKDRCYDKNFKSSTTYSKENSITNIILTNFAEKTTIKV